jgi:hypothetical protein
MTAPETLTGAADYVAALSALEDLVRDKKASVPTKTGGSYSYSYADLADALGHIRPILAEHHFAVTQPAYTDEHGFVCVSTTLVHSSGAVFPSDPLRMRQPDQPQALGSIITYLRRYSLLAAVGLATEDDDGAAASSQRASRKPAPAATPAAEGPVPTTRMSRTSRPAVQDAQPAGTHQPITDKQLGMMQSLMTAKKFVDRDDRLAFVGDVLGRQVASSKELSSQEASRVINALQEVED